MRTCSLAFVVLIAACGDDVPSMQNVRIECGGGVFASTDPISGPTVGVAGNDHDNPFRALAIDPTDPDVVYVGSEGNGVFRSLDGGQSWERLRAGLLHCDAYAEIYDIAIDPLDPSRVVLATNAGPGAATGRSRTALGGVYVSVDGGSTFVQRNAGLPTGDANSVSVSPFASSTLFVGLGGQQSTNANDDTFYPGGVFTSVDDGATWTAAYAEGNITQGRLWQLVVRGTAEDFDLYTFGVPFPFDATRAAGLVRGRDRGATWSAVTSALSGVDGAYFDVSSDGQTIYVDENTENPARLTWKSIDGGESFTNPPRVVSGPIRIVGTDPDVVLYASFRTLYRSTDGMQSDVVVLTTPEGDHDIAAIEVAPSNDAIVYVTAKGLRLYRSDDAGETFVEVANLRAVIGAL